MKAEKKKQQMPPTENLIRIGTLTKGELIEARERQSQVGPGSYMQPFVS